MKSGDLRNIPGPNTIQFPFSEAGKEVGVDIHLLARKYFEAMHLFSDALESIALDPEYESGEDVWPDQKQVLAYRRLMQREETRVVLQLIWENEEARRLRAVSPPDQQADLEPVPDLSKHGIATHLAGLSGDSDKDAVNRFRIMVFRVLDALEYFGLVEIDKPRINLTVVRGTEKLNALMLHVAEQFALIF